MEDIGVVNTDNIIREELNNIYFDIDEANQIMNKIIEQVKEHIEDKTSELFDLIFKIEAFIKQNPNVDRIAELYSNIGISFIERNDVKNAYLFCLKAYEHLDFIKEKNFFAITCLRLTYCCNNLNQYSKTIKIAETVLGVKVDFDREIRDKILYNMGLAQKKLNQYSDALISFSKIDLNATKINAFHINIMKANCYAELKLYKKALVIYFDYINNTNNNDPLIRVVFLNNIIDTYRTINDKAKTKKYLLEAMALIKNNKFDIDNYYLDSVYYDLTLANMYIGNEEDTLYLLNKNFSRAKYLKKYKVQYDCINNMFDLYYNKRDFKKLEEVKILLLELLLQSRENEYNTLVYKYIKMYDEQDKKAEIHDLVNFMIDLKKKNLEM